MRYTSWQAWVVLGIAMLGLIFTLPNLLPRSLLADLPDWLPKSQITLGLDLQGGSHILLEVDTAAVLADRLESLVGEVRIALREARIGYRDLGVGDDAVRLRLTEPDEADAAREALQAVNPLLTAAGFGATPGREFAIEDGVDGQLTLRLTEAAIEQRINSVVAQSLEVVRRRIDELGTREPTIQRQGQDRILVQVPGERDPENIKNLLGKTARLTFHMVDMDASITDALAGRVPPGSMVVPAAEEDGGAQAYVVDRRVELSGENLVDSQPTFQDNQPVVSFRFDSAGARKFGRITQDNVGNLFAIVLDDEVISAPRIREPILGGSGVISGNFSVESANQLAILLRAGALPAPLNVVEERTVGPDLGADSVRAGALAAIVAVVLVIAFMALYYGLFGLFADLALFVNVVLIIGALSVLGATLTLPGIAGIVLTIGMAVDSNVLIFERIREERDLGKSPLAAIEAGFSQALRTIIDANLTTLIAALVLFQFGTGPIKGFAVTLSIGVLTTMFTAYAFTRLVVSYWYWRARPKAVPL